MGRSLKSSNSDRGSAVSNAPELVYVGMRLWEGSMAPKGFCVWADGNMWSAISIAMLCIIVIWGERKQGSALEEDKVM